MPQMCFYALWDYFLEKSAFRGDENPFKDTYFVIYGIISEFTDKGNFTSLPGQFEYLTLLRGLQGGLTCKFDQVLSTAKNLSIGYYFA